MEYIQSDNQLVLYCVPDEETHKELEQTASGCWRVFNGESWKFYCKTREQAELYCKRNGGTHIGLAQWNDGIKANVYRNVQEVRG